MSSITKTKDTYIISYYFQGKKVRRSLKVDTKKDALTAQSNYDDLIKEGNNPDTVYRQDSMVTGDRMPRTVGELVDDFLKNIDDYNINKTTKHALTRYLTHLLLYSPQSRMKISGLVKRDEPLENITRDKVKKIFNKLKDHYSPNSCVLLASYFRWLFTYAVEEEYITKNPFSSDKRKNRGFPKGEQSEIHCFNIKQVNKMMDYMKDNKLLNDFVMVALKTGLRRAELFNLKWRDNVDFENRQLRFRGKKTNEFRTVPLPDVAVKILQKRHDKIKVFSLDSDHRVFPELKYVRGIYKHFNPMMKELGIKATFHDLRHTYGTNYIKNGGNLKYLQQIMGHKNIETTLIYVHLAAEDLHQNIDALTKSA